MSDPTKKFISGSASKQSQAASKKPAPISDNKKRNLLKPYHSIASTIFNTDKTRDLEEVFLAAARVSEWGTNWFCVMLHWFGVEKKLDFGNIIFGVA